MFATFGNWRRYLDIVKSPYNGITFDCGVTRELGEDPVAVCRYLGKRDVINHVHFRNVTVRRPYEDYTEVWLDEGQVNMFEVMKELVRQRYSRSLLPSIPAPSISIANGAFEDNTPRLAAAALPVKSTITVSPRRCSWPPYRNSHQGVSSGADAKRCYPVRPSPSRNREGPITWSSRVI